MGIVLTLVQLSFFQVKIPTIMYGQLCPPCSQTLKIQLSIQVIRRGKSYYHYSSYLAKSLTVLEKNEVCLK